MTFWQREFLENSLYQWLAALIVFVVVLVILRVLRQVVVQRLRAYSQITDSNLDDLITDVLSKTKLWFFGILAVKAASIPLTISPEIERIINPVVAVAVLVQIGIWISGMIGFVISHYLRLEVGAGTESAASSAALTFLGRLVLWAVIFVLALHNLGFEVTTFVTGLGIGGIAVALAAQNILGDLFASLSILLDKPFVIGDFIVVGEFVGTVERIGLKTTRVRSLAGEQLIFSNNDLLNSRIRNFKRMYERRILFSVGVTYQTPYEKVEAIPSMVKEIIEAQEQVRFDRAHFKQYGDSALIFEIVYYVLQPDYNVYMDTQQKINLEIYRRFEQQGIEFAYPTQTVYLTHQNLVSRADLPSGEHQSIEEGQASGRGLQA
ncbi:MAG: mechanosensitive ion channel family protein [Acidobacteriota bacterium]